MPESNRRHLSTTNAFSTYLIPSSNLCLPLLCVCICPFHKQLLHHLIVNREKSDGIVPEGFV